MVVPHHCEEGYPPGEVPADPCYCGKGEVIVARRACKQMGGGQEATGDRPQARGGIGENAKEIRKVNIS